MWLRTRGLRTRHGRVGHERGHGADVGGVRARRGCGSGVARACRVALGVGDGALQAGLSRGWDEMFHVKHLFAGIGRCGIEENGRGSAVTAGADAAVVEVAARSSGRGARILDVWAEGCFT